MGRFVPFFCMTRVVIPQLIISPVWAKLADRISWQPVVIQQKSSKNLGSKNEQVKAVIPPEAA